MSVMPPLLISIILDAPGEGLHTCGAQRFGLHFMFKKREAKAAVGLVSADDAVSKEVSSLVNCLNTEYILLQCSLIVRCTPLVTLNTLSKGKLGSLREFPPPYSTAYCFWGQPIFLGTTIPLMVLTTVLMIE